MYVRRGLKTEAVHPVEYSLTDLFHGVKNKAQVWVFAGLKEAKERFPFKIFPDRFRERERVRQWPSVPVLS